MCACVAGVLQVNFMKGCMFAPIIRSMSFRESAAFYKTFLNNAFDMVRTRARQARGAAWGAGGRGRAWGTGGGGPGVQEGGGGPGAQEGGEGPRAQGGAGHMVGTERLNKMVKKKLGMGHPTLLHPHRPSLRSPSWPPGHCAPIPPMHPHLTRATPNAR